jgi:uncharacterized membrane protein YeaQ/YmgE (transglycosylase-associated protein family)
MPFGRLSCQSQKIYKAKTWPKPTVTILSGEFRTNCRSHKTCAYIQKDQHIGSGRGSCGSVRKSTIDNDACAVKGNVLTKPVYPVKSARACRLQEDSRLAWKRLQGEAMGIENLLIFLSCGALAGWLAGVLLKGSGLSLSGNVVAGIFGGVIGGYLFGLFDMSIHGVIGSMIKAMVGAIVLLYLIELLRKTENPAIRKNR